MNRTSNSNSCKFSSQGGHGENCCQGHIPMSSKTDGAYPEGHKKFPFECSLKGTILLKILTTVFS